jgi:uncharacterized RmlC-like cupin family protein
MSAASPRIQRLTPNDRTVLESPGKRSEQIVWPENAPSARITLTRVTMEPGATSATHMREQSRRG